MNANSFVIGLLRSPLHQLISGSVLLLEVTGRRSGKVYQFPVNYIHQESTLWVVSQPDRLWTRNLRGGAPLAVYLKGRRTSAHAETLTDPAAIAAGFRKYFETAPQTARYFGIKLDADGGLQPDDLASLTQERVIIKITLDEQPSPASA